MPAPRCRSAWLTSGRCLWAGPRATAVLSPGSGPAGGSPAKPSAVSRRHPRCCGPDLSRHPPCLPRAPTRCAPVTLGDGRRQLSSRGHGLLCVTVDGLDRDDLSTPLLCTIRATPGRLRGWEPGAPVRVRRVVTLRQPLRIRVQNKGGSGRGRVGRSRLRWVTNGRAGRRRVREPPASVARGTRPRPGSAPTEPVPARPAGGAPGESRSRLRGGASAPGNRARPPPGAATGPGTSPARRPARRAGRAGPPGRRRAPRSRRGRRAR